MEWCISQLLQEGKKPPKQHSTKKKSISKNKIFYRHIKKITLFVPEPSSQAQQFIGWLTSRRPELINPRTVGEGEGREGCYWSCYLKEKTNCGGTGLLRRDKYLGGPTIFRARWLLKRFFAFPLPNCHDLGSPEHSI